MARWASSKIGVPVFPAKPLHIALFITELTNVCLGNNTGVSPIEAVVHGIRFLFILLVVFYGFFSIDEINSFCLKDVTINADHMSIYVTKRKK